MKQASVKYSDTYTTAHTYVAGSVVRKADSLILPIWYCDLSAAKKPLKLQVATWFSIQIHPPFSYTARNLNTEERREKKKERGE